MSEVTLEKLDLIKERIGVSYGEAKEALQICDGDVVEAIIYLEEKKNSEPSPVDTTVEQFKDWLKETVEKGNVTRIRVKKDDKVLVDVPVNAGVAAGIIAVIWWPIAVVFTATALVAKITIEITKDDGSVEVVNKVVKATMKDVKGKVVVATEDMKEKIKNMASNIKDSKKNDDIICGEEPIYQYTVNFEEDNENKEQ